MQHERVRELVLEALEHERAGVKIYRAALQCAIDAALAKEWTKYLEETETHVRALESVCDALETDPEEPTRGRELVRAAGEGLVRNITAAMASGDDTLAQLVACECVVHAETKDHLDWELLGAAAQKLSGPAAKTLQAAHATIEDQEDEHLYHTKGWCRELWMQRLGLGAVLPPPMRATSWPAALPAPRTNTPCGSCR